MKKVNGYEIKSGANLSGANLSGIKVNSKVFSKLKEYGKKMC